MYKRQDTACFMWGYELDPYVEPDLINKSIMKARIPLRESMLLQACLLYTSRCV